MSRIEIDGPDAELADVLDELRTLPFLADVRMVVVRDADPFISRYREHLERYVAEPSETGVLVLVCKVMNKQWRLTKAIQKIGLLMPCKAPPPWDRDKWLVARARQAYGKQLDRTAARALTELAGDDMATLDAELAKLAIYVGDRDGITDADAEALVGLSRPENVFRMTEAIAAHDAATAIRLWRQTLATDKQAAFRAVGGVAWAVRQMIAAKQGVSSGANPMIRRGASRFTLEQLHDMLVQLLAADVASKTGLGPAESGVEKFIVRQCTGR
jgi:DNA polymerase-3 subunit delta